MAKLSQLGTVLRPNYSVRMVRENHVISFFRRESSRMLSAETGLPSTDSAVDSILETTNTGLVFAKLFGITRQALKTDIIKLLEGCKLTLDDVKVDYNRDFNPTAMMVQFSSHQAFDHAIRLMGKNGRMYRLERVDRSQWDLFLLTMEKLWQRISRVGDFISHSLVLLRGIPRTALPEDVERFLSGCNYDASSINMFLRPAFPDPIRMATVRFPSQTQAMHAFLAKNRGFCQNNQILMRVLQ